MNGLINGNISIRMAGELQTADAGLILQEDVHSSVIQKLHGAFKECETTVR